MRQTCDMKIAKDDKLIGITFRYADSFSQFKMCNILETVDMYFYIFQFYFDIIQF